MSVVEIKLFKGVGQPQVGSISWVATKRVPYEDGLLLPAPIEVQLYNGRVLVDVPPSPEGLTPAWAWRVTENVEGGTDRLVIVPDTLSVLSYRDDLIDLESIEDPGSPGGVGEGVTDHGLLTGLADDDHPHYLTQTRGDARYYTKTQVDTEIGVLEAADAAEASARTAGLATKADTAHTHDVDDINATGTPSSTTYLRGDGTWEVPPGGGGSGVSAHGDLTGLDEDDHPQYLTQARGDARYYTETEVIALLSSYALAAHGHAITDVTDLQAALDTLSTGKASTTHTHTISQVSGLQTELNNKATVVQMLPGDVVPANTPAGALLAEVTGVVA